MADSRAPHLHIVADENIPGLEAYEQLFGSIRTVASAQLGRRHLEAADAVLVRSVTKVDRALLEGTSVRFVGSATAGTDHVDESYLRSEGIAFAHAPGSNATSVVEYVLASMAVLGTRRRRNLPDLTAGIIGCGHVGGRLARRLEALGMRVLRNDPPRREQEGGAFHDLEDVLRESDIITLHVPLVRTGRFPTHHLIGARELEMMKPDAWLINASRGAVASNRALLDELERGTSRSVVLDVWEGEPYIDRRLLDHVDIATPHIAGYSYDAKLAGTHQVMASLMDFFEVEPGAVSTTDAPHRPLIPPDPTLPVGDALRFVVDQMYDVVEDDRRLRASMAEQGDIGAAFHELRRHYPRRYSFERYTLAPELVAESFRRIAEDGLGIHLKAGLHHPHNL